MKNRSFMTTGTLAVLFSCCVNAQVSPMVYDSSGIPIGLWQGSVGGDTFVVLSPKNVFFAVDFTTGEVKANSDNFYQCSIDNEPLYSSVDCSGVARYKTQRLPGARCGGILKRVNAPSANLILTPFNAVAAETLVRSRTLSNGSCSPYGTPQVFVTVDVIDNDPATSGVANASYPSPLSAAIPGSGNCLFRNGFEICQ